MIQKNKKQLLISSILILLPIVAGLILWNRLPEQMATHWGANGEVDGWSDKTAAIFGIPILMIVIHWICILVTIYDCKNKNQNHKVFGMVLWIIPIITLVTSGTIYAVALGNKISIDIVVRMLLGVLFVILGNYMPKCRQNHTIGVRIGWTLSNEENWNKTHRFAGKIWVAGGMLILATMLIPMEDLMFILLGMILLLVVVPVIYSYLYHRKQIKAQTITKKD